MGAYDWLEGAYYDFVDLLEKSGVPFGKYFVEPIESRGVPSLPVFFALLLACGLLVAAFFLLPSSGDSQLVISVYAGGEKLDGAAVAVYDESGRQIASGQSRGGTIAFRGLPRNVLVKASAEGFVASLSSSDYLRRIDLGSTSRLAIQFFSPSSASIPAGEYAGQVDLLVLDAHVNSPLAGASVLAVIGSEAVRASTGEDGKATLSAPYGSQVKLRVSREGYRANSLTITAVSSAQTISLTPLSAYVDNLEEDGQPVEAAFGVTLVASDLAGNVLGRGSIEISGQVGEKLVLEIEDGEAHADSVNYGASVVVKREDGGLLEKGRVRVYSAGGALLFEIPINSNSGSVPPAAMGNSLMVLVQDESGAPVASIVSVFEANTLALLQEVDASSGEAIVSELLQGMSLLLRARSAGFIQLEPVPAVFGSTAVVTLRLAREAGSVASCTNGLSPGSCLQSVQPLYCPAGGGILVANALACGCAEGHVPDGDSVFCIASGRGPNGARECSGGVKEGECIPGVKPLACGPNAESIVQAAAKCGCPAGYFARGDSCISAAPLPTECPGGINAGECIAQSKPLACAPDASSLVELAGKCGCPEGYASSGNSCVPVSPGQNECPGGEMPGECIEGQKPFACGLDAALVQKASQCGCPLGYVADDNVCRVQRPSAPKTTFKSFGSVGRPVGATWTIFSSRDLLFPFAEVTSGSSGVAQITLPSGTYEAYAHAPGRLTVRVRGIPAGATVSAELPSVPLPAPVVFPVCIESGGSVNCVNSTVKPGELASLRVLVRDSLGAPISGALVSVRGVDGSFAAPAQFSSSGTVTFASLFKKDYVVTAVSGRFVESKRISLSEDSLAEIFISSAETAVLSLAAVDASSGEQQPLSAAFSVTAGTFVAECASPCTVSTHAGTNVIVGRVQGFSDASSTIELAPGQVKSVRLQFSPLIAGSGPRASIQFTGAFDEFGSPASRLSAGKKYFLAFNLAAQDADEAGVTVRLGSRSAVELEPAGLLDFESSASSTIKSTTYGGVSSVCADANNNAPRGGLYKWAQVTYASGGGSLSKRISFPVLVRQSAPAGSIELFYNALAKAGARVTRVPPDAALGNSDSSPQKAACYADSTSLLLQISAAGASLDCTVGSVTIKDNYCAGQKPLKCVRGDLVESASECGCPAGFSAQGNSCVQPKCADGTILGACSLSTAPKSCELRAGTAPVLIFNADKGCGCSLGHRLSGSACVKCADASCSEVSSACRDAQGRLVGEANKCTSALPLRCTPAGTLVKSSGSCGCPEGLVPDSSGVDCVAPAASATCVGLGGAVLRPGECDSTRPLQCVLSHSGAALVSRASSCGCPAGSVVEGDVCVVPDSSPEYGCVDSEKGGRVLPGCVAGRQPLYCDGSTKQLAADSSRCPCPSGAVLSEDGTSCVPSGGSTTPRPTSTPRADYGECSPSGVCTQDGFFCSFGKKIPRCSVCNPECGGNDLQACDSSSGLCSERSCTTTTGEKVQVNECVPGKAPSRCTLSGGFAVIASNSAVCGCPEGKKPDSAGRTCVACRNSDCAGELNLKCRTPDSKWHAEGCLPESYSKDGEAVKACSATGAIAPDAGVCGCRGEGYERTADGKSCVIPPIPSVPPELPPEATCIGCISSDEVYFNPVKGELETATRQSTYELVADAVFPADAMRLFVRQPKSGRIILKTLSSRKGTESCYAFDESSGKMAFDTRLQGCPLKVRGNSIYDVRSGTKVNSDEAVLTFSVDLPPKDLKLTFRMTVKDVESVRVTPTSLEGPRTPGLVFIINNKQTSFGTRELGVGSGTVLVSGAGVEPVAWRGPDSLSVDESGEAVGEVSYSQITSYFECVGEVGKRHQASSCSDAFCCAGLWCSDSALRQLDAKFRQYALDLARETAFRRGDGEPYKTLEYDLGRTGGFEVYTAAMAVEGSQAALSGAGVREKKNSLSAQCNAGNPAVYYLKASTTDGKTLSLSREVLGVQKDSYVSSSSSSARFAGETGEASDPAKSTTKPEDQCTKGFVDTSKESGIPGEERQPLCDFLHGTCDDGAGGDDESCIQRTKDSTHPSNPQKKDEGTEPKQVDSPFVGTPPVFKGATGMLSNFMQGQSSSFLGNAISGVGGGALGGLLGGKGSEYYQPVMCEAMKAPYKTAQQKANTACDVAMWTQGSMQAFGTGQLGIMTSDGCTFLSCTTSGTFVKNVENLHKIKENLRKCEDAGGKWIDGCKPGVQKDVENEKQNAEQKLEAALKQCENQCESGAAISQCGPQVTGKCTAITPCKQQCKQHHDATLQEAKKKIDECKQAAEQEIAAGEKCEEAQGVLKDLPINWPVDRSSYSICPAYSAGCEPLARPKKPYSHSMENVPGSNQLTFVAHYGLTVKVEPVSPSDSWQKLTGTNTNNLYNFMGGQKGQSTSQSGFLHSASQSFFGNKQFGAIGQLLQGLLGGKAGMAGLVVARLDGADPCAAPLQKPSVAAKYSIPLCLSPDETKPLGDTTIPGESLKQNKKPGQAGTSGDTGAQMPPNA